MIENGCHLCDDHVRALCAGVDRRGMGHLVQRMGGAKAQREPDGLKFCPLQTAEIAIYNGALRAWGLLAWTANPEGTDRCYLCEEDRRCGVGAGIRFMDGILDQVLEYAHRERFMPRPRSARPLILVA